MDQRVDVAEIAYQRHGIPREGFRNYWYPVLKASELGRKPRGIEVLGESIVLFRDGGKVHALDDRCPHRGVKLSLGSCEFPGSGTVSCPYHGWTFAGDDGRLVAALMEGADSAIVGKVRVRTFPVAERAGLIFVFVGELDQAPALEDDLPPFMADPASFFHLTRYVDYEVNWRYLVDNWPHDHHGPYLHRTSPELLFQPLLPFAQKVHTSDLGNDRGLGLRGTDGIRHATFPGLGDFPRPAWYRFMKPTGRGNMQEHEDSKAFKAYGIKHLVEIRLPGLVVVGRQSGDYCLVQWAVPLSATRTRLFNINNFRKLGTARDLYNRAHYLAWRGWAHDLIFSGQDKRIVESTVPGTERLSRTDAGVIAWRKYAGSHARRAPQPAEVQALRSV